MPPGSWRGFKHLSFQTCSTTLKTGVESRISEGGVEDGKAKLGRAGKGGRKEIRRERVFVILISIRPGAAILYVFIPVVPHKAV